ncbi:MAG: replicative DNA helicase [bacterium]
MDVKNWNNNKKIVNIMPEQAPASVIAERALLSNILLNNNSLNIVLQKISSGDFYDYVNKNIFTAMEKLYSDNQNIDIVSLESVLKNEDGINYPQYLVELFNMPEGLTDIDGYTQIIKKKSVSRKLISLFEESKSLCFKTANDPYNVIYEVENNLSKIIEDENKSKNYKLSDVVDNYINRETKITGIHTGFNYLDELTTGFQNSNLIIIAARPSIGKTALALKIALNMANQGKKIAFFTIEMSKEQIAERTISLLGRVNSKDLRKGNCKQELLQNVLIKTEDMGIYVNDDSAINIVELKAKIKQLKQEKQVDIAFIDYLQLIKPINSFAPREQAISDISRGLKAIAKDLDMPIIALAQLNRLVEARSDKRPVLADLRESGSIEQDADVVIMIHRPGFYDKTSGKKEINNKTELVITKQRNGSTGVVNLMFVDEYSSFEEQAMNSNYGYDEEFLNN